MAQRSRVSLVTYETSCTCTTKERFDFVDITERVQHAVAGSGVRDGRATVFSPTDDCSLLLNERESGLLEDVRGALDRVSKGGLMDPPSTIGAKSVVLPVVDGRLRLGTWQRLLLFELDSSRERSVRVQVIGE